MGMIFADGQKKDSTYRRILKKNLSIFIPTFIIMAAFMVSILAPGNKVRMGLSIGMSPIKAIVESFKYALIMPAKDWLKWPVWILLAISVPFMWNIVKGQKFKFSYPGMIVLLGYCITSAGFTPCLYAQGSVQAGRLHDTIYFILILIMYIVLFYILGWIYQKKYNLKYPFKYEKEKRKLSVELKICIVGLVFVWIVGSVFHMGRNTDIYVGTQALYSLVSGQAQNYRQENEKRLKLLKSTEEKVILPKFTNTPSLLQFDDISPNPEEWLNTAMAVYYGKESVQREE